MNRTTGAQRHNARMDKIWEKAMLIEESRKDFLPTCSDYKFYLSKAIEKFGICIEDARTKYGQFTYRQWRELLGLF